MGNDEYARTNRSFGLTTLQDHHVEISGSTLRFEFRGKSGKIHRVSLSDRRLARIVARCQAVPGADLFQYLDDDGNRVAIGSGDVNDYLREITGEEFTAKDFRTWAGTLQAVAALDAVGPAPSEREAKAAILKAIDQVAERLNNTRAVCRKYYVHPAVLETYEAGTLHEALNNGGAPPGPARSGLSRRRAGGGPAAPTRRGVTPPPLVCRPPGHRHHRPPPPPDPPVPPVTPR